MALFDDLKSKVTEMSKSAMQKSNEIVEVTKINLAIGDAQSEIDKVLKDVGEIIYGAYQEGANFGEEIESKCIKVDEIIENINGMKEKLAELKKVKICPNCEGENEPNATFCSKCGNKMDTDVDEVVVEEVEDLEEE